MQRFHTYKIAVSKYQGRCEQRSEVFVKTFFFFFFWGGGGVRGGGETGGGGGSQGGCEQRIEVFVKIQKKKIGWVGLGGQSGCERRIEVCENSKKKIWGGGRGRVWGVRVDVIEEMKSFWENSQKIFSGGGGVSLGGGGSGWM